MCIASQSLVVTVHSFLKDRSIEQAYICWPCNSCSIIIFSCKTSIYTVYRLAWLCNILYFQQKLMSIYFSEVVIEWLIFP